MVLDDQTLIELYTTMLTIRRFEERVAAEFYAGNIFGFIHSYIGQEAIATGVCRHLSVEGPHRQPPPRPRPLHRQGRRHEAR